MTHPPEMVVVAGRVKKGGVMVNWERRDRYEGRKVHDDGDDDGDLAYW